METRTRPRLWARSGHCLGSLLVVVLVVVAAQTRAVEADTLEEQSCYNNTVELKDGEAKIAAGGERVKDGVFDGDFFKTVYLWPTEGFRGLGLQALADTATGQVSLAAWFSMEDMFRDFTKAACWELRVYVTRFSDRVLFGVRLGDDRKRCSYSVTIDKLLSLEVVGYGASRWGGGIPPPGCHCQPRNYSGPPPEAPTCTALPIIPPATAPATTPATPSPPNTLVVAVMVTTLATLLTAVVLAVMIAQHYTALQRLQADQKGARGPAWPGTHRHAAPPAASSASREQPGLQENAAIPARAEPGSAP